MPCLASRAVRSDWMMSTSGPLFFRELVQLGGDRLVGLRVEHAEGEVLQLLAHALHAHAPGERRIDLHRLLGDARPLLLVLHVLDRAHVVQPVGELDEEDADVLRDGEQQFAEVLRLLRLARDELQPLQLGDAFHELADRRAEELVDLVAGGAGVLDRVVQQRDRDGGIVEPQVGQDGGDFERMGEIGVAGGALLRAMLLHGVDIGAVQKLLVDLRVVGRHPFDELVLTHHRPRSALSEEIFPDRLI